MPLISFSGLPLSGKTSFSNHLHSHLQSLFPSTNIIIINDSSLGFNPSSYDNQTTEKSLRASFLSAVERHLTKENIVIVDSLNYIKGFRYQLYCIARAIGTPSCVIYSAIAHSLVHSRNNSNQVYSPQTLSELISRFEEPNDLKNRWDFPLFTVIPDDDIVALFGQKIIDAIIHRKSLPPNQATVTKPIQQDDYLQLVDKLIQNLINLILDSQRNGFPGGALKWSESIIPLSCPSRKVPLTELKRLKRQYLMMNKLKSLELKLVADSLVEYFNSNL